MTMSVETPARIRALLALYRESHYDVELPDGGIATIRVGALAPPSIVRWLGTSTGVYMTACNPHSRSLPREENEQRLAELCSELRARKGRFLEGAGHVPGASWREPSVLISGIDEDGADALARRHQQNCTVIVRKAAPATMRIYRPDWQAAIGATADIEWA